MPPKFDTISAIVTTNHCKIWSSKKKIIRLWRLPNFKYPNKYEMILLYEKVSFVMPNHKSNLPLLILKKSTFIIFSC